DTLHPGMWRVPIGGEFRIHRVAGPSAELGCLHVLDRAISDLGPDKNVEKCGHAEKPSQALQGSLAIECSLSQPFPNLALAQVNTDWNQHQPGKKNDWQNQKNHDSDIRIIDMTANLQRQDKKPRNRSGRNQSNAHQTQPMASEQKPGRPL